MVTCTILWVDTKPHFVSAAIANVESVFILSWQLHHLVTWGCLGGNDPSTSTLSKYFFDGMISVSEVSWYVVCYPSTSNANTTWLTQVEFPVLLFKSVAGHPQVIPPVIDTTHRLQSY